MYGGDRILIPGHGDLAIVSYEIKTGIVKAQDLLKQNPVVTFQLVPANAKTNVPLFLSIVGAYWETVAGDSSAGDWR